MKSVLLLVLLVCHGSSANVISFKATDNGHIATNSSSLTETSFINSRATTTRTEVKVEENWNTNKLTFIWDDKYFAEHFDPTQNYVIQFIVYVSKDFEPVFTASETVQVVGLNSGTATVSVSAPNLERLSSIRYPYFYVLKPVGTKTSIYLSSVLFAPTLAMTESTARGICSTWSQSAKIPTSTNILPCPPCLCQAEKDANFAQTIYNSQIVKLANGALNDHVLFYEEASTRTEHAQTCSYNLSTGNLAVSSPSRAGWLNYFNKFNKYKENFNADIWPYIVCCLQSNSNQYCDLFHAKRPINTGQGYPGFGNPCGAASCG